MCYIYLSSWYLLGFCLHIEPEFTSMMLRLAVSPSKYGPPKLRRMPAPVLVPLKKKRRYVMLFQSPHMTVNKWSLYVYSSPHYIVFFKK